MTVTVPGYTTLTGRPATILRLLEETQVWDGASGQDYIEKVQEATKRFYDIDLSVTGETYEERAESLLQELAKNNLIKIA